MGALPAPSMFLSKEPAVVDAQSRLKTAPPLQGMAGKLVQCSCRVLDMESAQTTLQWKVGTSVSDTAPHPQLTTQGRVSSRASAVVARQLARSCSQSQFIARTGTVGW